MKNCKTHTMMGAIALLTTVMAAVPAMAQQGRGWRFQPTSTPAAAALTQAEQQKLAFMREEEKLARDVYQAMYEKWKLPVFERIAGSEQRHFDAVGRALARYAIADPAKEDKPGVFANAELAALYAELIARGNVSAQDALNVGVTIEKKDIEDLENAIRDTRQMDLKRLYANLLQGSLRHLLAFEANLQGQCPNQ
ncbi:MAG: DUF2202 domain-containing protein [Bryobacteraceae bacterium]